MIIERWKDVAGYEGLYQVSNIGRVRSITHTVKCKNGTNRTVKGRLLSARKLPKNGSAKVCLYKNGKHESIQVPKLVAAAFIDNPLNLECVIHIDGNKLNNHYSNLVWADRRDIETNKRVLCVDTGVVYLDVKHAAKTYCIEEQAVSRACRGETKQAHGLCWKYI